MKLMAMMLCVVLWFGSGGIAQEHDWLSGTWKGIRKLEFVANPTFRQRQALNSPGSATVLHLQYDPTTKTITGQGEAQNLRFANSTFTETVLAGSFFDGDKGILILGSVSKVEMDCDACHTGPHLRSPT